MSGGIESRGATGTCYLRYFRAWPSPVSHETLTFSEKCHRVVLFTVLANLELVSERQGQPR